MKAFEQYALNKNHYFIGGRAQISWKNSEEQISFLNSYPPVIGEIVTYDIPDNVGGDDNTIFTIGSVNPPSGLSLGGILNPSAGKN